LHGIKDNFALPIDPATPDIGMTTLYASFAPNQNYDESGTTDRIFIDSFNRLPCCIIAGELETRMRPNPGIPDNDAFNILFVDNAGNVVGPSATSYIGNPSDPGGSLLPPTWDTSNYGATTVTINLANQPTPSGPANSIPTIRSLKFLDVLVQDDTNLDYIDLKLVTGLGGDIDGDGCVDAADLTLLAANFGISPIPNGVGDPNGDGMLDAQDLTILAADFGKCCPEPTFIAMAACGIVGLLATRRRPSN
jgi:hypothetical protein